MKRCILILVAALLTLSLQAARKTKKQEVDSLGRKIKTGWNFGALPSVAFNSAS